ncbi:MAG: ATP-binding cassette domain-containing protein, partial [Paracoccus sp. (in: a-proteobacteria)]
MSLLEISGLRIALNGDADQQVVKGLDLSIEPGQTMCLVGESGSGKSLTALATMGLLPSALKIIDGSIPLMPDMGICVTDVRDVAEAHVRAIEAPAETVRGERF